MKLLLDQNLSFRFLDQISARFPGSTQARVAGLEQASDLQVWEYAKQNDLTVVTKSRSSPTARPRFSILLFPSPALTLSRSPGFCKVFPDSYFPLLVEQFDVVIPPLDGGGLGCQNFSPFTPSPFTWLAPHPSVA